YHIIIYITLCTLDTVCCTALKLHVPMLVLQPAMLQHNMNTAGKSSNTCVTAQPAMLQHNMNTAGKSSNTCVTAQPAMLQHNMNTAGKSSNTCVTAQPDTFTRNLQATLQKIGTILKLDTGVTLTAA
ncbi:hypothetical protein LSAT2_002091, partial [Lamellibrachia satsuma]